MVEFRQILLILLVPCVLVAETTYTIPELHLEALKSGDFRVYVPDVEGMKFFSFHGNVNHEIVKDEPGELIAEIRSKTDGYWVETLALPLQVGDTVHYWIYVNHNRLGYRKDGSWVVQELQDSFEPLVPINDDKFSGDSVDT